MIKILKDWSLVKEKRKVNLVDPNNEILEAFIEIEFNGYGEVMWPQFVIHDDKLWKFHNHTIGAIGQYRKEYARSTLKE